MCHSAMSGDMCHSAMSGDMCQSAMSGDMYSAERVELFPDHIVLCHRWHFECAFVCSNVFSDKNTPVIGIKANIHLKPNSKPLYHKSAVIPYAMMQKVDNEIHRLLKKDIM